MHPTLAPINAKNADLGEPESNISVGVKGMKLLTATVKPYKLDALMDELLQVELIEIRVFKNLFTWNAACSSYWNPLPSLFLFQEAPFFEGIIRHPKAAYSSPPKREGGRKLRMGAKSVPWPVFLKGKGLSFVNVSRFTNRAL